jgi:hypothetical protein
MTREGDFPSHTMCCKRSAVSGENPRSPVFRNTRAVPPCGIGDDETPFDFQHVGYVPLDESFFRNIHITFSVAGSFSGGSLSAETSDAQTLATSLAEFAPAAGSYLRSPAFSRTSAAKIYTSPDFC